MSVDVSPASFHFVSFDAGSIRSIGEGLVATLGLTDHPVQIVVDETTPLARTRLTVGDTIIIRVESGAFEDTRKPRCMSEVSTATALGRALVHARDRLHGGFAEAPSDDDLSPAQVAAWETYCVGRLERIGIPINQQPWRHSFRDRHGSSDRADAAFDQLWSADGLTWAELNEISRQASATPPGS